MLINKLKVSADSVLILYAEVSKNQTIDYSLHSKELARPELHKALSMLADHVVEMLDLPDKYAKDLEIRGVSFTHTEQDDGEAIFGAVITGLKKLSSGKRFLVNTPHATEIPFGNSTDYKACLSEECVKWLYVIEVEAEKYIHGERAQIALFEAENQAARATKQRTPPSLN